MNKFDDEIRMALRREEPSPDFTNRVMARIQAMEQSPVTNKQEKQREENNWRQRLADLFRLPTIKWAMAGAMAVVLIASVIGVTRYREQQRQIAEIAANAANVEGQRAKQQVMLAMRIASSKLNVAQRKVKQAGQRDDGHPQTEHQ